MFTGPAIEVDAIDGGTSGRFSVARVIARAFPKHRAFVQSVIDLFDSAEDYTFSPYPGDKLIYKSDRVVEYRTPPKSEGLGTMTSRLQSNEDPIDGVAILQGQTPDLLLLSVRLPSDMKALRSQIILHLGR